MPLPFLIDIPLWIAGSLLLFTVQYTLVSFNVGCILCSVILIRLFAAMRYALRWVTWPIPERWHRKQRLFRAMMRMRSATTYSEWLREASELDLLDGGTEWRSSRSTEDELDEVLLEDTIKRL